MSTMDIPNEIWILILDHLKIEDNLKEKEKLLNEREHDLNIRNAYLIRASDLLEQNLNEASILINHLAEIENNMKRTIDKVGNIIDQELLDQ